MFGENVSYDMEVDGFKIADIPAGGGLATAFVSPGKVLEDTIEFNTDDPTEQGFTAQGESMPTEVALKSGMTKGSATLFKVTAEVAADLLGGTIVAGQFHSPRKYTGIEKALQITDGNGMPYTYPRVHMHATVVGRFRIGEPNSIALKWTVKMPTDPTVAPEIIGIKTP